MIEVSEPDFMGDKEEENVRLTEMEHLKEMLHNQTSLIAAATMKHNIRIKNLQQEINDREEDKREILDDNRKLNEALANIKKWSGESRGFRDLCKRRHLQTGGCTGWGRGGPKQGHSPVGRGEVPSPAIHRGATTGPPAGNFQRPLEEQNCRSRTKVVRGLHET